MNSATRVLNTLRRQPADRPPWVEIGFHPTMIARLAGREVRSTGSGFFPLPDPAAYEREIEIWIEVALEIGLDALALKNWGIGFPSSETHAWAMDGGTIKSLDDVERILDLGLSFVRPEFAACAPILIEKCRRAGLGCFFETSFGIGVAVTSIGFQDLILYSLEQPEILTRFFDYCEQGFTPVYELFHELGPDFMLIGDDIAFGQGPYLRPQDFRALVMPHFRRMAKKIDLPWMFHSDGNLMPVLDDLLSLGMSALHPIEPYGTMDIVQLKEQVGERVTLCGNLDMNLIANGAPAEIEEGVRWLHRHVGRGGGWMLSSSNSIDSGANPENVRAMGRAMRALI